MSIVHGEPRRAHEVLTGTMFVFLASVASVALASYAPVTTHPRLFLTPTIVSKLRTFATNSNPAWARLTGANGVRRVCVRVCDSILFCGVDELCVQLLTEANLNYDTYFFPGGKPNRVWVSVCVCVYVVCLIHFLFLLFVAG